ncbi:MAG TPA: hypothetical protein VF698_20400 [Thermoanaerobaculia bacterium]|jgi:hypothetical protein
MTQFKTSLEHPAMTIIFKERGPELRERLRARLEQVASLRCEDHDRSVVAVTIHGRENGWFDSTLVTCCEGLEQKAAAIVKERC